MKSCIVCNLPFAPEENKDRIYVAIERHGAFAPLSYNTYHEALDCPRCGCQNKLNRRLPRIDEDDDSDYTRDDPSQNNTPAMNQARQ